MIGFFSGLLVFLLLVLYDLGQSNLLPNIWSRLVRSFFLLGFTILAGCTAVLVWAQGLQILLRHSINFGFLLCAFLFLGLLIYTLFFALPFQETYVVQTAGAKTYDKGMYALCRHPGVLWFTGFYCCLWLALGGAALFWLAFWYSLFNVGYVLVQDYYTFPRIFTDYAQYKRQVPFLLPNVKSFKNCILTLRKVGD